MGALTSSFTEKLRSKATEWMFEDYDHLKSQITPIVKKVNIDGIYDLSTSAIGVSRPSLKPEGQPTEAVKMQEGYTVMRTKKCYAQKTSWTKECSVAKIEAQLKEASKEWAEYFTDLDNYLLGQIFNTGGYTAGNTVFDQSTKAMTDAQGGLCYDGKAFFTPTGTKRSSKGGGTYYNGIASNDLSSTNLETALNLMTITNSYNERDQKIAIRPNILVCGPALQYTAKKLLESELVPENANHAINPHRNALELIVLDWITDTDFWALGCKNKGIFYDTDGEPVFSSWFDPDIGEYFVKAERFVAIGVYNWRYWQGNNYSTS